LTAREAEALALAGLPGAAADLGFGEALPAARLKLRAALPPGIGEGIGRVGERFHLDASDWYRRIRPPPHLIAVAEAVWRQQRLRIRYESWAATVSRIDDPLGIVMKAGDWYFVAQVDGGLRTYKIAKLLNLELLEEPFERQVGFDLAAHWQRELLRFEASLRRGEAVLRVSAAALSGLKRLGTDMAEAILAAAPDGAGWRQAKVAIESVDHAADLLLGFGPEIEVVSPPALRRRVAEQARRILALYDDRGGEATGARPSAGQERRKRRK
jgi:predicted DNA-binding transcriptional regulator YafY